MLVLKKLNENSTLFENCDYIAVLSDRVDCGKYINGEFISAHDGLKSDMTKLLELRIFNEEYEYRAFRDNLGEPVFLERIAADEKGYENYFDELHYLDIATTYAHDDRITITTTGGGSYSVFGSPDICKVMVRTYLKKGANNIEYVHDWRVIGYRGADFVLPGKER